MLEKSQLNYNYIQNDVAHTNFSSWYTSTSHVRNRKSDVSRVVMLSCSTKYIGLQETSKVEFNFVCENKNLEATKIPSTRSE